MGPGGVGAGDGQGDLARVMVCAAWVLDGDGVTGFQEGVCALCASEQSGHCGDRLEGPVQQMASQPGGEAGRPGSRARKQL